MKLYFVRVKFSLYVLADSEEEAREVVMDGHDIDEDMLEEIEVREAPREVQERWERLARGEDEEGERG